MKNLNYFRMLILLLLTLPAVVQAQFDYTIDFNTDTITITGYYGPGGDVDIPDNIDGYTVTGIGDRAFIASSLTSVTIPNSVTSIGVAAFAVCSSLTSVTIPDSVTTIGNAAFASCTSLSAITVDAFNSVYSSVDGVVFNKSQTVLILFPGGKARSYTIPTSVTSIGSHAFYFCTSLTNVAFPNSVTNIGNWAFYSCTGLTSVTIPNSISSIGNWAFSFCTSLANVTIGNGVTSIGYTAFTSCTSLTDVTIPDSVTSIGGHAFSSCTNLTSVTIGTNVTSIGDLAFLACTSLSAIAVDALNSVYSSVDGVVFNKSQTVLILFPGGKAGGYTIPNNVTSIGNFAFYHCTSLTSVTIPNSITSIGEYGFYFCTNLTGVYFQGNAPSEGGVVFLEADNVTVYYLPGTTGWGTTFAGRPAVLWNPLVQTSDASFGVRTNRFGFTITGASNLVLVVEAATNLANPAWIPVGTNTLTGGSSYFSDPEWMNHPVRFYRLRAP